MRITVRFPLGVYHAQSQDSFDQPEWPPHPVRLVGALVAAAHSAGRKQQPGGRLAGDLALLRKLCDASPPLIGAPGAAPLPGHPGGEVAAQLVGATRWAPRNYFSKGGREQSSVQKMGVAIGDQPIHFDWLDLELNSDDLGRLSSLVEEISFLGTSRSPAIAHVAAAPGASLESVWTPIDSPGENSAQGTPVRVPDATTLAAFDRRHEARSSAKADLEPATTVIPGIRIGHAVLYAHSSASAAGAAMIDPRWWGEMVVLAIDRERSEVIPRSSASYLFARAVRTALLGAYEDAGEAREAPPILRGRGDAAHCAIVPLADVWHEGSKGTIKGVALLVPNADRIDDPVRQLSALEHGLASLVGDTAGGPQRYVCIPDAGRIWLKQPSSREAALRTLIRHTYREAARTWVSVTPVIHARWRKRPDETLLEQVTLDCSHVGLPVPIEVEAIRGRSFPGAASRPVPTSRVPEAWRSSLGGPCGHLRITFPVPVAGPVLLGRARHFGLGLLVPESRGFHRANAVAR